MSNCRFSLLNDDDYSLLAVNRLSGRGWGEKKTARKGSVPQALLGSLRWPISLGACSQANSLQSKEFCYFLFKRFQSQINADSSPVVFKISLTVLFLSKCPLKEGI